MIIRDRSSRVRHRAVADVATARRDVATSRSRRRRPIASSRASIAHLNGGGHGVRICDVRDAALPLVRRARRSRARRARVYACTHTTRDIARCVATGCINDVSLKRTETRRDRAGVVALGVARGVARVGARRAMANGARATRRAEDASTSTTSRDVALRDKVSITARMRTAIAPEAVDAVRRRVADALAAARDDDVDAWCTRETCERFLRADKGDVAKATKRLRKTIAWRAAARPGDVRCERCFEGDFRSHYMQQIGFDACGRAIVYSDIGLAMDHKAASNVEHCVQVLELLESFLPAYPYDQYVWVCDFHRFGAGNMAPSVATKCMSLFARSYPERLEMMIFVEAPKIFNGLYTMLRAFVDPVTVQKLRFVKGPHGKGGGANCEATFREFFSEETTKWLVTEMSMNRKMWSVAKAKKSWIKSMIIENGVLPEAAPFPEFAEHDCRGTPEFLASEAGAYATNFAKKHARRSALVAKTLPEFCTSIDGEEVAIPPSPKKTLDRDAFSFVKAGEALDEFDRFD